MEKNSTEQLIIPEVPKVIPNEQLYVYIPVASCTTQGIVAFDGANFDITNGKVFLKSIPTDLLSGKISEDNLPFTYIIDDSLTQAGAPADASKVGQEFSKVGQEFETLRTAVSELIEDVAAKEDKGDADNNYNALVYLIETVGDEKLSKAGGTISGSLTIGDNLTVKGKTTVVDVETVNVEDNLIVINKNAIELRYLAGLAINASGTNTTGVYGIMYDPDVDGVKLGFGRIDENGNFYYYENGAAGQFIATVDWKIPNGNLAKFNEGRKTFEDSGISAENVATKSEVPQVWRY